ncbi:hypothetical protein N431DRAFT_400669 [Stipitochalara longipes BDJ]|nr:hypothetical protein N431DRAFT_400669 [Stipitochalara longipes BDJ]
MASGGPSNTPTAGGSSDTPMSDSPPKYVPQFSAATEMILKRINSGVSGSSSLSSIGITGTPPGYEDMRRSVLMGMKTTLNMEMPTTPINTGRRSGGSGSKAQRASATPSGSAAGSASGGKGKGSAKSKGRAGTKRKRVKDESESTEESDGNMSKLGGDSDSDVSEEATELPKITQSGRQVNKPAQFIPAAYESASKRRAPSKRTQEQALCKRCGRGHSPQSNMIVFCDGCNLGWHQMCHDPVVSEEAVKDELSPWFCSECSRKKGIKSKTPESVRGVSWQGKSADEKRAYLSSLPHQQLVSLLLQATVLHPNLPIFPATNNVQAYVPSRPSSAAAPTRTNVYPQQPFPPSATATAGLFSRAEANPNAPINFIRKIQPGQTPPASSSFSQPSFTHASSAPPTLAAQGGEESRDSTPASPPYPKAGNGLMAKLGPDDEDLEWLVDSNDFDAFSHVVYDQNGEKAEENGIVVNGA